MRFYHAGIARFLQRDFIHVPPENAYVYSMNVPTTVIDPTGLRVVTIVVAVSRDAIRGTGVPFNASNVQAALQGILDQCFKPCTGIHPSAKDVLRQNDVRVMVHVVDTPVPQEWRGSRSMGLAGGGTSGGGAATRPFDPNQLHREPPFFWWAFVGTEAQAGFEVTGPGAMRTPPGSATTAVHPTRAGAALASGAALPPQAWADAIAHEQLWHGLLAQRGMGGKPGTLASHQPASRGESGRLDLTPADCEMLARRLGLD